MVTVDNLPGQTDIALWSSYSSPAVGAAFRQAKRLGFNCVRLALRLHPQAFAFPTPSTAVLASLTDACNQASTAGVKLQLVMFKDWEYPNPQGAWGMVTGSETWAGAVIGAVQASSLVFASTVAGSTVFIEAFNELAFASTAAYAFGYDSGYPGSTVNQTAGTVGTTWAQVMIPYLRTQSGGLVTVSTANTAASAGDLTAAVAGLTGTEIPDWYEWHSYAMSDAGSARKDMAAAKTAAAGAPLAIGECGKPASSGESVTVMALQNDRWAAQQLGLGEPAPFQLYQNAVGDYGLFDVDGAALSPVRRLYGQAAPGMAVAQFNAAVGFVMSGESWLLGQG